MTGDTKPGEIELREGDIPDLHISDHAELTRIKNLYGESRVVGWLKVKVGLPTRLEAKRLKGDEFDEDAYYKALADHYCSSQDRGDGGECHRRSKYRY